jgi:hypothetical protein
VLDELVHRVEELHPGCLCSILLLDTEGRHLQQGGAQPARFLQPGHRRYRHRRWRRLLRYGGLSQGADHRRGYPAASLLAAVSRTGCPGRARCLLVATLHGAQWPRAGHLRHLSPGADDADGG